ncbi:hypothetical protein ACTACQ_05075 [Pseudomonas syringae]|uniref:hypothetical protein n=1 Tax=Pseudomonas syringae TaxID=317 RepID=UPI0004644547|nr:hypothetical protein [Pseudomonas syringae]
MTRLQEMKLLAESSESARLEADSANKKLSQQLADVSNERDRLRASVTELESGLRIIAVAGKGSSLGGLKMVAKQSLNRAFSAEVKS